LPTRRPEPAGSTGWDPGDLDHLRSAHELEVATPGRDGLLRAWVPVWLVVVDEQLYVRTWYRRDTGWFGAALRSRRARVRVPGLEAAVVVTDVGDGPPALQAGVDAAYRGKYGDAGSASMVGSTAAATTLRLDPDLP